MTVVEVEITRFIEGTDDSYPGFVEFALTDARGSRFVFVDKVPIVTSDDLGPSSEYPCVGEMRCTVVEPHSDGVIINTELPDSIESECGRSIFVVSPAKLSAA